MKRSLICRNHRCLSVKERDGWWQSTGRTSRRGRRRSWCDFSTRVERRRRGPRAVCITAARGAARVQGGDQLLRNVKQKCKSRKWQGPLPPAAGVDPEAAVVTRASPAFFCFFFHTWTAYPLSKSRRETIFVGFFGIKWCRKCGPP